MPITLDDVRTSDINMELCEQTEQEILDILNKHRLNMRELVLVLAQTLIDVGGTIAGIDSKLTYDEMRKRYALDPQIHNALMALGTDILSEWIHIQDADIREENK